MKLLPTTYHLPPTSSQSGQIFILAIIVLALILVNTVIIIGNALTLKSNSTYSLNDIQATSLAEAGIDKAVASLNATGGSYNGETETPFGVGTYSVTVTNVDLSTKIIQSTGYVSSQANAKAKRTVSIQISKGVGISFIYGMLMGNGGIIMGNGSTINGSVYSNGNIDGGTGELITGDVFVAGGTQPSADQQSDCSVPNCSDFIFGKKVGVNDQLDVAQSFQPTVTNVINKVSLKLKKVGSPSNITVRIVGDDNNSPNKADILAAGVLSANLVTNEYGFVDVTFNNSPTITTDTRYWIILDGSLDNNNYWIWSMDTLQSYVRGSPKWSADWQDNHPSWNNISGDLGFKTWMGGVDTSIVMQNNSVVGGSVHAHRIDGFTINKDAYYQNIQNAIVKGTAYPNTPDLPPAAMPISDANILDWQNQAQQYGEYEGDIIGCPSSIGPGKFIGNFTTANTCTITVNTPIWLTGNLTVGNSIIFSMNPSLGNSSGVIIVDGLSTFSNTDDLLGTGQPGSYLTLLSTYNSITSGLDAINTGNSSITGILYAPYGRITLANRATFKEVVAYQINMGTNTILTYDSGLISTIFSAGPSGAFSTIKNTYTAK